MRCYEGQHGPTKPRPPGTLHGSTAACSAVAGPGFPSVDTIYLFIEDFIAQSTAQDHLRVFTSSNIAQIEYNTKHAHYINVKHTHII